jgi:hypothetical protein
MAEDVGAADTRAGLPRPSGDPCRNRRTSVPKSWRRSTPAPDNETGEGKVLTAIDFDEKPPRPAESSARTIAAADYWPKAARRRTVPSPLQPSAFSRPDHVGPIARLRANGMVAHRLAVLAGA